MSVASVTVLGLIGWGSLQLIDIYTGGSKATAADTKADCASKVTPAAQASAAAALAAALPKPGQITVNVFNATPRSGLAKQTADELKKRGFKIGDVGNATAAYDKKVAGAGILLGAKGAEQAALPVLNTQLSGAQLKTDGRAKPATVDLIIGTAFKALTDKADADKALTVLSHPEPAPASAKKHC